MFYTLVFIYGLLFGSFFNVVGLRVPKGESIVAPASHCTNCQTRLTFLDLVPVLSYCFLRGKCRHCDVSISPIYPLFELLTGILFVVGYWQYEFTSQAFLYWLLVSLLIIITVSDVHYQIIPDKVLILFLIVFVLFQAFFQPILWKDSLLGLSIAFGLLFAIAVISKGGMGGGDIKLFAVLGFVLGWQGFFVIFILASMLGAIVGITTKVINREASNEIAFGPFIAIGAIVAFLWGNNFVHWYWNLFI